MNLEAFEKAIENETQTEAAVSFAEIEMNSIKQKIEKRKIKQKRLKIIFFALSGVIVLLVCAFGYSQYKLYTLSKAEKATVENVVAPKTGEEVVKALSRHILLPEGTPQIAEVKDVTKLRETQAFFKNAENGDIVVVYETTIFVYRPSKDIVVASGDISGVGQVNP